MQDKHIDARVCVVCKELKPISEYVWDKRGNRYVRRCNTCTGIYFREVYYPRQKARLLAKNNAYRKENMDKIYEKYKERGGPIKSRAHAYVSYCLKTGKLKRQPCFCGEEQTIFHHTNGYERENWLVGEWVCRIHHAKAHREMRWQTA